MLHANWPLTTFIIVFFLFQETKIENIKFEYIKPHVRLRNHVFLTQEERDFLQIVFAENIANYKEKFPKAFVREMYKKKIMAPLKRNLDGFESEKIIHFIYEYVRNVIKNKLNKLKRY